MPQLIVQNDPYANENAAAIDGFSNVMGGGGIEARAKAQALAAQMRAADLQQQRAAQEMQLARQKQDWELADRKKLQAAEDAAGNYWRIHTKLPVPVNGVAPTRQAMEDAYAEQNYNDQMMRLMTRTGKGSDLVKGMGDMQTNYQTTHPSAASMQSMQYPPEIAGNPVAMKKYDEERAKKIGDADVAKDKSREMAAQILPQILHSREAFHDAYQKGGVGKIVGSSFGRMNTALGFGETNAQRAAAQDEYEKASAFWQSRQIAAANQGLGAMSNYEQQLARDPFAKLTDVNESVGLNAIDRQLAYNLQTLGVPGGIAPRVVAALTSGRVPKEHYDMLISDLQKGDMASLQEFLDHYGAQ